MTSCSPALRKAKAGKCWEDFWEPTEGARFAAREKHARTREQENIWNKYFLENRNLGLDFFTRGNVPIGLADSDTARFPRRSGPDGGTSSRHRGRRFHKNLENRTHQPVQNFASLGHKPGTGTESPRKELP